MAFFPTPLKMSRTFQFLVRWIVFIIIIIKKTEHWKPKQNIIDSIVPSITKHSDQTSVIFPHQYLQKTGKEFSERGRIRERKSMWIR